MSSSEQQSGVLAAKLNEMCPPGWMHPDDQFQVAKGHFRGKYPSIGIRHVSGGWSRLYFRWTGQRTLNIASATVDGVWFDEPPSSQRAYREAERRTTRTGGEIRMTFTPVNAPVDYIREEVDAGIIRDIHYRMEPQWMVPTGDTEPLRTSAGEPMDAAWIEQQRRLVMGWEAAVVLDGEWEFRALGRIFTAWDPERHLVEGDISEHPDCPTGEVKFALGIDYGDDEFRQVAILIAIDDSGRWPKVIVLDECISTGRTTTDEDGQAIVDMLARSGLAWRDLTYAHGDRRYTGARGSVTRKSNRRLQRAIAAILRVPTAELRPEIRGAKRGKGAGAGAKHSGCRWLHEAMVRPGHFLVSAKCKTLSESIGKWDWGEKFKDPIDALRYAAKPWITAKVTIGRTVEVTMHR